MMEANTADFSLTSLSKYLERELDAISQKLTNIEITTTRTPATVIMPSLLAIVCFFRKRSMILTAAILRNNSYPDEYEGGQTQMQEFNNLVSNNLRDELVVADILLNCLITCLRAVEPIAIAQADPVAEKFIFLSCSPQEVSD
jgi:hypothetical protein